MQLTGSATLCGGPGKGGLWCFAARPRSSVRLTSGPWDGAAHSREGLRLVARLLCERFLEGVSQLRAALPWAPGKGPGGWSVRRGAGAGLRCRVSPLTLLGHSAQPVRTPLGLKRPRREGSCAGGASLPWHSPSSLAVRRLSKQEGQGKGRPRLLGETVNATGQGALCEEGDSVCRLQADRALG